MTERKCKKCGSKTRVYSLEAFDDIHIHDVCTADDAHPYFCRNGKRWI